MEREYNVGTWLTPSDEYIKDIKQTLVENNYANENTPIGELNPIVQQVIDEVPETFERMDLSKKKKVIFPTYDYYYFHSNGIDCYGSYSSNDKKGIYHLNLLTGEETQIYTTYNTWKNFFEASDGTVYTTGLNSTGIIALKNKTSTKLTISGIAEYFFEASDGVIYVGGGSETPGIYSIINLTLQQVYSESYNWQFFYEDTNGSIYASSSNSNTGLVEIKDGVATKVYSTGYKWKTFFKTSKGVLYVLTSGSYGIICIINGVLTPTNQTAGSFENVFETSKGVVYAGSSNSNGPGIVYLQNETANRFYTGGYQWDTFYEDKNGNVYVSSTNSSSVSSGIILLNGQSANKIFSTGYNWNFNFEHENGSVYASSPKATGILVLKNGVANKISSYGNNWQYFTERDEGVIASQTPQPDGSDFLLIDKDTNQVYLVKGGE